MQAQNESHKLDELHSRVTHLRQELRDHVVEQPVSPRTAAAPQPCLSAQQKEAVIQPLLTYANAGKFIFWTHQHAARALQLVTTIRQATSTDDIKNALIAEKRFYPGATIFAHEQPIAEADKPFSDIAKSYNQIEDSGYYKAIHQTLHNIFAIEVSRPEQVKASYK